MFDSQFYQIRSWLKSLLHAPPANLLPSTIQHIIISNGPHLVQPTPPRPHNHRNHHSSLSYPSLHVETSSSRLQQQISFLHASTYQHDRLLLQTPGRCRISRWIFRTYLAGLFYWWTRCYHIPCFGSLSLGGEWWKLVFEVLGRSWAFTGLLNDEGMGWRGWGIAWGWREVREWWDTKQWMICDVHSVLKACSGSPYPNEVHRSIPN